jgi:hypothetical protein
MSGKYFVLSTRTVTDSTTKESREERTVTEVSLVKKLRDEPEFVLDNVCTWIAATGQDEDKREYAYHKRVTLREYIDLKKPKRVGPYTPKHVVLGHVPEMPSDKEIEKAIGE